MPEPVDLKSPESVSAALREELNERLPGLVAGFAQEPRRIQGGMEAAVFTLQLDAPGAEQLWQRPLILRVPRSRSSDQQPQKAAAVQTFLADRGARVPRPLATGGPDGHLGRTWLLMERLPAAPKGTKGKTVEAMARFHSRLHAIDTTGWPLPAEGPLVDRRLGELLPQADAAGPKVRACLEWLDSRREVVRQESRSVTHNDFFGNVLLCEDGELAAVDWVQADVGDYHDDVARAVNLFWIIPLVLPLPGLRAVAGAAVGSHARRYRDAYSQVRALDHRRIRYWAALHTAEWATMLGAWARQAFDEEPAFVMRRVSALAAGVQDRLVERFWCLVRTRADRPL